MAGLSQQYRWYWYYNSGLQAQSVLYRSIDEKLPDFSQGQDGPGGEIFFDVSG
jgi:prolyl oligopeptidase